MLRTHILRPTWHYVAREDLRWLMTLTGPRLVAAVGRVFRYFELDSETLARATNVIATSVTGATKTRPELMDDLVRAGLAIDPPRLANILMYAETNSVVTSGPTRGKAHTYALFDERVPPDPGPEGDEALSLLAWRYFSTRGPVTVKDFIWWSGLKAKDARVGLELNRDRLDRWQHDGITYWLTGDAAALAAPPGKRPRADLVQCYDELIISYSESRHLVHTEAVSFRTPKTIDGFRHLVVLDGRLLGHWRIAGPGGRPEVELRLDRAVHEAESVAVAAAVERYVRFAQ